jgi:hypothetical protein
MLMHLYVPSMYDMYTVCTGSKIRLFPVPQCPVPTQRELYVMLDSEKHWKPLKEQEREREMRMRRNRGRLR